MCFPPTHDKTQNTFDSGQNISPERGNVIYYPILCNISISQQNVHDVLLHLNISNASGLDLMHPRILKIASAILKLFKKSLKSSYFPHMW
jgi:hypothetical protein